MKIRLKRSVNVLGLEWPAGEHEVEDPFWAEQLARAVQAEPAEGEGANGGGAGEAEGAQPAPDVPGPGNGAAEGAKPRRPRQRGS